MKKLAKTLDTIVSDNLCSINQSINQSIKERRVLFTNTFLLFKKGGKA